MVFLQTSSLHFKCTSTNCYRQQSQRHEPFRHVCTTQGLLSLLPIWVSQSVPIDKTYNPAGLVPPLFHLGSYNPNKCNSYFANSLVTVFSDSDLERLLSFQTSCPFSIVQIVPSKLYTSMVQCNIALCNDLLQ